MENKTLVGQAENDFKDLIAKYPTLDFFVTKNENFACGFREKEPVKVEPEVIVPTEATEEVASEIETTTVDPVNPQPVA